jgi:proline iminopeptidase
MHTEAIIKREGYVERDGFNLKYSIEGDGAIPALVVGSAIYYPRTFSVNLRKHLKLIFLDHRGFVPGPNTDASKITLDVIISDIEYACNFLGLKRFIIVGHSGHGYMALEYAKKYPQRVSHVVLIATGPDQSAKSHEAANSYFEQSVCHDRKRALEKDLAKLPHELETFPEKRFITFCLRLGARSWYDYTFDASPLWTDVHVNMPIIDQLWGVVFRDLDITKGLKELKVPVLIALGKFDYLVAPFFTWNAIRSYFNDLTMRFFEKSSHTPQLEEPDLFDQELVNWIDQKKFQFQ